MTYGPVCAKLPALLLSKLFLLWITENRSFCRIIWKILFRAYSVYVWAYIFIVLALLATFITLHMNTCMLEKYGTDIYEQQQNTKTHHIVLRIALLVLCPHSWKVWHGWLYCFPCSKFDFVVGKRKWRKIMRYARIWGYEQDLRRWIRVLRLIRKGHCVENG